MDSNRNCFLQGCDVDETWLELCCRADEAELRLKLADILRQRNLVDAEVADALEYIVYAEEHVTDTLGNAPSLTLQLVLKWSQQQRLLYLAEAFLNTRSN